VYQLEYKELVEDQAQKKPEKTLNTNAKKTGTHQLPVFITTYLKFPAI
jgi:hypothetical protein